MKMLPEQIIKFLGQDERSKNVNKNSVMIFICKGVTMLISFFLLPLTVGYVNSETYGLWVTISSMAAWLSVFDIGMGNGFKNKFVECRARGDNEMVKKYVSTTYAMLCIIFIPLLVVFLLINPFVNWNIILNVKTEENLNLVFAIVISYFALNFILSTINTILIADQRPGDSSIRIVIQQLCLFIIIFILTKTTAGSLMNLCVALCVVPLLIIVLYNITLFNGRYKSIRPSFKSVEATLVKDLLSLSLKFFYLQIVGLILFQLTNFIIIHYYGANDVTLYNVAHKYFTLPNGFFVAISTPIWAAIADALAKKDYCWIQESLKRYTYILFLFALGEIIMLLIAQLVYKIWMGNTIGQIPFLISLFSMLSAIVAMSTTVYVNALCGAGILKLQMLFCVMSPIAFLVLCFLFIKVLHWGVWCILLANLLANVYGVIVAPLQCYKVFYKRRGGLWNA